MNKRLTFLITSGPTREYLDPVRFLSNASSGRMGAALAIAALRKKHKVIFVTGPSEIAPPDGVQLVPVVTARDMFTAVKRCLPAADIVIGAAAVADYRPAKAAKHKIKKNDRRMTLELVPNPDILGYAGQHKGSAVLAGFALESRNVFTAAREKMRRKNLDCIVANMPAAIGQQRSTAWIIPAYGETVEIKNSAKQKLAGKIIDETLRIFKDREPR
jgi:phosphopantothenoylcysteine synthetase/decarboxylase